MEKKHALLLQAGADILLICCEFY